MNDFTDVMESTDGGQVYMEIDYRETWLSLTGKTILLVILIGLLVVIAVALS